MSQNSGLGRRVIFPYSKMCTTFGTLLDALSAPKIITPATRPMTLPRSKLHPSLDFSATSTRPRMSLHHAPNVSPIWSTKPFQMCYSFGAQNDSKCASEMEAQPSKARLTGDTQICAYTKWVTHLEPFLPPNVSPIWNLFCFQMCTPFGTLPDVLCPPRTITPRRDQ